jgi:tetratricopeptide (TPR) repeat protein
MNKTLLYLPFFFFLLSVSLFADIFPFQTIEKAHQAYVDGKFRQSARLFNTLDRDDASVAYNRANAYYKAGMYDLAERSYLQAKGVDEVMRMHNLGNVYFKKREFKKAIHAYERSLEFKEDKDTRFNLELAELKREENKQQNRNEHRVYQRKAQYQKSREPKKIEKKVSDEERMRKEELSHLLQQISKEKMPTMLYRIHGEQEEQDDSNPW